MYLQGLTNQVTRTWHPWEVFDTSRGNIRQILSELVSIVQYHSDMRLVVTKAPSFTNILFNLYIDDLLDETSDSRMGDMTHILHCTWMMQQLY